MHRKLKQAFYTELEKGKNYLKQSDTPQAYCHFERAHILGQCFVWPHIVSHYYFLRLGVIRRDGHEVFGQIIRLIGGAIGSAINRVPMGNTGGANVNPFLSMPIPDDLQELLDSTE